MLDLCYAPYIREGVATIIDGQKIGEGVSTIYERRRMRLLSWGSLLLLLLVLDICYALGEGGVATIIDGQKNGEGVSTIYVR